MKHVLLLLSAALGGCATLPPVPPTAAPADTRGAFVEAAGVETSPVPVPAQWWRRFEDPALDRHVARSLDANTDLRIALANLDSARALARQATAAQHPRLGVESGAGPMKAVDQPSTTTVPTTDYDVGLTLAYEIDLFGRARATAAATRADTAASAAMLDAVRVAVVADTVTAYVDWCGASTSLRVADDAVASQLRSADLVATQFREGEVSALELGQARAAVRRAEALVPAVAAERQRALYQLAALEGSTPAAANASFGSCDQVPTMASALPIGDGAELIAGRPDIREAQARLEAAVARVGVATADLYPRISLGASAGLTAGRFDSAITPLLSWAFLDRDGVRARIAAADAGTRAALAVWDAAMLRALREVESTLAAYRSEVERHTALMAAMQDTAETVRRARARHRIGEDSYLIVLDAERMRDDVAAQIADSKTRTARLQIALYRALGGGWDASATRRVDAIGGRAGAGNHTAVRPAAPR